ncbi:expressed unknown protein [Seminavis robusta]|uniref:Uncharacterized protein n=1 Tax=Seminavis robusta TaxID=568900 RepID=A0A9N8DCM3_9STRA|nr:expressed unknown protein [Seminavis robusta]|eukprot:Sro85_g045291.1  (117) ;mRNA; f:48249-48599
MLVGATMGAWSLESFFACCWVHELVPRMLFQDAAVKYLRHKEENLSVSWELKFHGCLLLCLPLFVNAVPKEIRNLGLALACSFVLPCKGSHNRGCDSVDCSLWEMVLQMPIQFPRH